MLVDQLREKVIADLKDLRTVQSCWAIWRSVMMEAISDLEDPDQILGIGNRLSSIFRETRTDAPLDPAEQQGALSGGGAAWEALVCWYLNLCLVGSTAVVVKRRSLLEGPITNAIAVKYGTVAVNSESDLIAVSFPNEAPFSGPRAETLGHVVRLVDQALRSGALSRTSATIIQCKTNWNDNAQMPMLWDLVYRATSFDRSQITVGVEGFSPRSLKSLKYAFVTVPTTDPDRLRSTSTAVVRLRDLSGKNYWGMDTKNGVALGLREIFGSATIGPDGGGGVRDSLRSGLRRLRQDYAYFEL